MRIAVLYNAVPDDAPPEDQDTLVQVGLVSKALTRLGHEPVAVACTLDLAAMCDDLRRLRPDMAFNLVEALANSDSLVYLPPAVLEVLGLRYTGSRAESLLLTTNKIMAKEYMRQAGLPTPDWVEGASDIKPRPVVATQTATTGRGFIVKGVWEQGSLDMDDDAVLEDVAPAELSWHLRRRTASSGRPCFAERFIDGREFAATLLAGPHGPDVHPPYEIEFHGFAPDKPRIVGYRAKWREDCFEYHQTPRRFDFDPADQPLLDRIQSLAKTCWSLFRLRGWARVDFRVDAAGQPWILEVNANPCLSPDAGFAAVLERVSLTFDEAIQRILDDT